MKNIFFLFIFLLSVEGYACPAYSKIAASTHGQKTALNMLGPVGKLMPMEISKVEGTTGGKWYRDSQGTKWFVKHDIYYPELQSANEVIATRVYRFLGYKTPESAIVEVNGKRAVAIKDFGKLPTTTMIEASDKYAKELRVVASYLKDWDRLRVGPNNAIRPDGRYLLFDFGGTLGARAQGEHKPGQVFSSAVGSFSPEETYSQIVDGFKTDWLPFNHVWRAPISNETAKEVKLKLEGLTDDVLSQFVEEAQYSNPQDAAYMKQALIQRRDTLIEGLGKIPAKSNKVEP